VKKRTWRCSGGSATAERLDEGVVGGAVASCSPFTTMDDKKGLALPSYQPASNSTSDTTTKRAPLHLRLLVLSASFFFTYTLCARVWPEHQGKLYVPTTGSNHVHWTSCGEGIEGYECANVTVPLDYHNASDPRTVTIAVTRFPATDKANRYVQSLLM
jgi:hypothetical protein